MSKRNCREKQFSKASTYTLCGGDVHVAADEGQTIIHAHLEINHPETKQQTQAGQVSILMLGCNITTGMFGAVYLV